MTQIVALPQTDGQLSIERCMDLIFAAEAELGAFLIAVENRFGKDLSAKAADLWLEQLESIDLTPACHLVNFREGTVLALSRLCTADLILRSTVRDSPAVLPSSPPQSDQRHQV